MLKLYKMCKKYFQMHKGLLVVFGMCLVLSGILSFIIPMISSSFIDTIVVSRNKNNIYKYCFFFGIVSLSGIIIGYFVNRVYVKSNNLFVYEMNRDIINHAQLISLLYLNTKNKTRMIQQINSDTQTVVGFCFEFMQNLIVNLFKLVIPMLIICSINNKIFIGFIILMLLYVGIYLCLKNRVFQASFNFKEKQVIYYGSLYEQLSKIKYITIHGILSWFSKRIIEPFHQLITSALKLQNVQYMYKSLDVAMVTLGQIFLFFIGGIMVIDGELSIGKFTLISSYYTMGIGAIRYFFGVGQNLQNVQVSYQRINDILNKPIEKNGEIRMASIHDIVVQDVSFAYEENVLIRNFSVKFVRGNAYAILGSNGIGKTTLAYLIMGIYKNYTGKITYDGIDIKRLDMMHIRCNLIGVVEQEPELFTDTVYNNIVQCRENLSVEDVTSALEEWFYSEKEEKRINVYTQINEKADNISGGERQKISMLRALLKRPDVFILDEPTSAMDTEGLKKVKAIVEVLKKEAIVIVITHEKEVAEICDFQIKI